jgi:hypothetical protein
MSEVDLARQELGPLIEGLRAIRYRLVGLQASIPPTRQETSPEDLEGELDAATEIRAILGNALHDLDPLIRDLIAAAGCERAAPAHQEPTPR